MNSTCLTPQWSIPAIGRLRPRYDAIRIVSSATVGALKTLLPVADLANAGHSFDVVRYKGKNPRLRSVIRLTCTNDSLPLHILAQHEHALGSYSIVHAEIAYDIRPRARLTNGTGLGESAEDNARKKQLP